PWAIFGAPLVLAVLRLIGLVGALLAAGAWGLIGARLLALSLAGAAGGRLARRAADHQRRPPSCQ
ncbi:MAG: hypothetical protein K0M78_08795, partial [Brevundimonas sp.]|nr:hypothetical protein [Brevundimonas sp.]